ncbi:DNA helicase UvrD [Candidatus Dependentiae bacterium]|nr:DNA helicase UvrD [Candidatus Dependentiae bacterium]
MPKIITDFHIHSKYSHATSKFMDLPALTVWSQLKGIGLMGTGDFTHPVWQKELKDQLEQTDGGLWQLRPDLLQKAASQIPMSCRVTQRFMLTSEISTIFKRNGKCYRVHSILLAPNFVAVEKITKELAKVGNLVHDGRPILGLDVKDLLKIVLDASSDCMLIPAHIWTPWFGLFGSKSGFNSLHDAFGELRPYIYAIEKGLSSNFMMNAMVSQLDSVVVLCNSDAHSLQNLGREANLMNIDMSYYSIVSALRKDDPCGFRAGIEFFPERGKYFADGHRVCKVCLMPDETKRLNGICPKCGKLLTIGVLNRVLQLADRSIDQAKKFQRACYRIVPLLDILEQKMGLSQTSKKLIAEYHRLLVEIGPEFYILLEAPIETIAIVAGRDVALFIDRIRNGNVQVEPGYDGLYGKIF